MPGCVNLDDAKTRQWYNYLYSDDAQQACRKAILRIAPTKANTATLDPQTPGLDMYMCTYDTNGDNQVYGTSFNPTPPNKFNDFAQKHFQVYADTSLQSEPECDLVPQGPYRQDVVAPLGTASGGSFSLKVRTDVLNVNSLYAQNLGQISDMLKLDNYDSPVRTRQAFPYYEDDANEWDPNEWKPTWPEVAQIDHIIPRRDIRGCKCGTNHPNNALVISAQLNNAMSNKMNHPSRIAILQRWVPGYVPSARIWDEREQEAATIDLNENDQNATAQQDRGGCNTSRHGTDWFGIVMIGAIVTLRRRRFRSTVGSC